ncbi:MAG: excinuclease ABC subunit UvrC [Bacillota bacterium]|nr:excinuclease ABC subunit UvrC [Bacillota bacterium]
MDGETLLRIKEKVKNLPEKPGVYFMKDRGGKIIYVGKAKILKNRVSQYFNALESHTPKVKRMVADVFDFDYIITGSEMEALVLECSEIKHYKPHYNILLKDDKTYPYIKINMNDDYPMVEITRRRGNDKARYFGPYTGNAGEIISILRATFKLPSCKRKFPSDIGRGRPCLNFAIDNCIGLCSGQVSRDEYKATIESVISFLEGNYESAICEMERHMKEAAEKEQFEKAAKLRDRISAVRRLSGNQKVVAAPSVNRDVIGYADNEFCAVATLFVVRSGRIISKVNYSLLRADFDDKAAGLAGFLKQVYAMRADIPREVLLPFECEDMELIGQYLSDKTEAKVHIKVPQRGELRATVHMVSENAAETVRLALKREEKAAKSIVDLQNVLCLENIPSRIEAIDISNMGGGDNVGAIVLFSNGEKDKSGYRQFKIKSFEGQDDYESMREVVRRRIKRYQDGSRGFEMLPDLLLVDGGKGQVSAVKGVLSEYGIQLTVYGMVKDDKHKTRGITDEHGEAQLKMTSPAFTLVATIQEEVHRFAIGFQAKTHKKKVVKTELDNIKGLGPKRIKNLLIKFGSVQNIKEADIRQLADTPGMNKAAALSVKRYFEQL